VPGPTGLARDVTSPDRAPDVPTGAMVTRSGRFESGANPLAVSAGGPGAPLVGGTEYRAPGPAPQPGAEPSGRFVDGGDPLTIRLAGAVRGRVAGLGGTPPDSHTRGRAVLRRHNPHTPLRALPSVRRSPPQRTNVKRTGAQLDAVVRPGSDSAEPSLTPPWGPGSSLHWSDGGDSKARPPVSMMGVPLPPDTPMGGRDIHCHPNSPFWVSRSSTPPTAPSTAPGLRPTSLELSPRTTLFEFQQ